MARAADGVPAVQGGVGGRRRAAGAQAPSVQALGDDPHRGVVEVAEARARSQRRDARRLGCEDQVVDPALHIGEVSVDRQGPGDVAGVAGVGLGPGVQQQQLPLPHRAVVAHPVQGAGVRAGPGDGLEAQPVALQPGPPVEGALDPALAPGQAGGAAQLAGHVVEAGDRGPHGRAQLPDLPLVLDQPQLREEGPQFGLGPVGRRHQRVDQGVLAAQHPGRDGAAQGPGQGVAGVGRDAEGVGGLREGPAPPDPELAVLSTAVELGAVRPAVARRARAGEHGDRVPGPGGLEDQDAVGDGRRPLFGGQMEEGGVRPERMVEVIAPDLDAPRRNDDPLTGEPLRHRRPPLGRVHRPGEQGQFAAGLRPALLERRGQRVRRRTIVAPGSVHAALLLHRIPPLVAVRPRGKYHFTCDIARSEPPQGPRCGGLPPAVPAASSSTPAGLRPGSGTHGGPST